jgi:hypothetical protein
LVEEITRMAALLSIAEYATHRDGIGKRRVML